MTDALRAGVVGTGNMGRHHARVYAALPEADLVGISDADPSRAAAVAESHETAALGQAELLDAVDVVSVAVPTRHHLEVARRAVGHGVAVLVEKPLAAAADEAEAFLGTAREADVPVAVGHVERFNPAVQALFDLVDRDDVVAVDARRLGPSRGGAHGDVVHDLMIHDLDVVHSLLGDAPFVRAASGHDGQYAAAVTEFETGAVGTFVASRVTQRKVRRLTVTTEERHVVVDYLDQSVRIHRTSDPAYVERDGDDVHHRDRSVVVHPTVERAEPLRRELEAFLDAVRDGSDPPVSGEDGLRALRLADRVWDAAAATTTTVGVGVTP